MFAMLISYIHFGASFRQCCSVGDKGSDSKFSFPDAFVAGELQDSKSTLGDMVCIFGDRTFVPMLWMCKTQTAVSHIDASLRMEVLLALNLWECNQRDWQLVASSFFF